MEDHVLKYDVHTDKGNSGGPLLIFDDEEGEWKVIGIHTHGNKDLSFNSGVYFTPEIVKTIRKF